MDKDKKGNCPFCEKEIGLKNMPRHVTQFCDKANAECPGMDLLQELERRRRKRKGLRF